VKSLPEIKEELDAATRRRVELWEQLGHRVDGDATHELEQLNARIAQLWDEFRTVRVRERFGSPEPILQRAERDKRLERELNRQAEAARSDRRAA
jgi:hypothetical protein